MPVPFSYKYKMPSRKTHEEPTPKRLAFPFPFYPAPQVMPQIAIS